MPGVASAQPTTGGGTGGTFGGSGGTTLGGCNTVQGGTFTLCDPLGAASFCDLIKSLLNILLAIGVPIAVLFLVWSGFRFILARGNTTELANARRNFFYVIIGIAVFLGAWTLATIIQATFQSLPGGSAIQFCGRA
jgi:hypothetical protein